ncbi:MAG: hypothetical protein KatS3mg036_0282 [Ignavibacterium sp.]|nr:MAG: hypothetical protein KatS3mg036_0282 [Ignavibacterium sp.]
MLAVNAKDGIMKYLALKVNPQTKPLDACQKVQGSLKDYLRIPILRLATL